MRRRLAAGSREQFWAAHLPTCTIDLFAGEEWVRRYRATRDWFVTADRNTTIEGRLSPLLADVYQDSTTGFVWLVYDVRDTRWRERARWGREAAPGVRHIESTTGDVTDLYDSIIEVFDPATGEILASMRSDLPIQGSAGPGRVSTFEPGPLGPGVVRIHRLFLDLSSNVR